MRKKLFVCLMLMMCILAQAVPVGATGFDISALPGPSEGSGLISDVNLVKDSSGSFSYVSTSDTELEFGNMSGDCKVVTYVPSTGSFWCSAESTTTIEDQYGDMVEMSTTSFTQFSSLEDALANACVTSNGETFVTYRGAYTLFCATEANSESGVVCCCKSDLLPSYVYTSENGDKLLSGAIQPAELNVILVDKVQTGGSVVSAKYRLDYKLGGYEKFGQAFEEHAKEVFVDTLRGSIKCDVGSVSGSIEFEITDLSNTTYEVALYTDGGNRYSTTFDVDFASGGFTQYTGSLNAPVITFSGLADLADNSLTEPLVATVLSDTPVQFYLNGNLVSSEFRTEFELELLQNGIYSYQAISEAGQVTDGSFELSCFLSDLTGLDLVESSGQLVQTGMENTGSVSLSVLTVVLVSCAVIALVFGVWVFRGRKKSSRFLSLILTFVLMASMFPQYASAGYAGSSVGGGLASRVRTIYATDIISTKYDGGPRQDSGFHANVAGYVGLYDRGSYIIRMRAFPIKDGQTEQGYFNVNYNTKTIDQLDAATLTNTAPGYETVDKWVYLSDGCSMQTGSKVTSANMSGFKLIQVFDDGVAEETSTNRPGSPLYKQFIELCGEAYSGQLVTNARELDRLLHKVPESNFKAMGEFLGLSSEDASKPYYIVIEQSRYAQEYVYGRRTQGIWGYIVLDIEFQGLSFSDCEWMVTETLATAKSKDPSYAHGRLGLVFEPSTSFTLGGMPTKWRDGYNCLYSPVSNIKWSQGDEAPFDGFTMGNKEIGYSLYSFFGIDGKRAGGNVAVEYQGDVNTSDPSKFVSTGSLIGRGEKTVNSYWDFSQNKWVDSDDAGQLLKFVGKIDTGDEYALCFTGKAKHTINGGDVKLNSSLKPAFETAPGDDYTTGSLCWGSPGATGGAVNVGHVWKVMTLDGFDNVGAIKRKFEQAFNDVQTDGSISTAEEKQTTDKYKTYEVLDGSWSNAQEGMSLSSTSVLEKLPDGSYIFKKDEPLGMGYEFIIRGTPVKSREITVLVDGAEDGTVDSVSCSQTWEENYTTAKNVIHPIEEVPDYTFVGWLVVPYQDDSVTDSIKSRLESSTCEAGVLFNAALSGAPTNVASSQSTTTLGIGSTKDDQPPEGYTVYKIAYKGPPVPAVPGTVVLPAYMLNRYFNNVIQTSSQIEGHPEKFTLARDWTWEKWLSYVYCDEDGHEIGPDSHKKNWVIEYYDAAGGNEFGLDNAMIDRYYPKGTGNWGSSVRSKLTRPWQESMNTEFMPENTHVVDYAFNLVRNNSDFGDARSISGISYKSYVTATGDSDNMLRIKSQFGVVPAVVKKAAPARNSNAVLKTYTETFDIKSRYQLTASATGNHVKTNIHSHKWYCGGCRGNSEDGYWCPGHLCYYTWESLIPSTCMGFRGQRAGLVNTISYQFTNSAFKYTTKDDLGKGKNDFLGTATSKPLTAGRRNSTAGSITPSNFYRYTTVRYSGVDLLFHPENYMVFKIGGTDFATINTQNYKAAYVMSEVKRTSQGSGMYFFRLNADITSVPGTVYSDSMQGGTGMMGLGGDLVSIPAGSDVTIAADPTGVAIDLYGYALDIVQTEDDGKIGAVGSGRPYNTVVADGEDAYSKWGNDSRAKIKEHFEKWCADMLEVENYAADFQLFVGNSPASGDLKSENFSATIGSVEKGAGVAEEGIYQLVVEKGVLVESKGDYNALISQISTDYGCSTAEAKQMFKESAIYTAIINGMETCKNPKNKSGDVFQGLNYTPDILASWNGVLGGDGNWYDETSRTFVIRRFTNLGNKLCDVIATDKIDYQLAPEGNDRFGEGVNGGVSFEGWWKLNIFFDQNRASEVNDLLLGSSHYYDPQNGSAGFNPANNAYSVLFNGIPVADANFKIPASSTQDFYN